MAVFDEGDDIRVIGTGADELCVGHDQVKSLFPRNFSEAKRGAVRYRASGEPRTTVSLSSP